jgi:hypothetical protein
LHQSVSLLDERCEPVDLTAPVTAIGADPLVGSGQRSRIEQAGLDMSLFCPSDKAGPLKHEQVFRNGIDRHAMRLGQLGHPRGTGRKASQKRAPRPVGEGLKYLVEPIVFICLDHAISQPNG